MTNTEDVGSIYVDEKIYGYLKTILAATRAPQDHGLAHLADNIESGAPEEDFQRILSMAKARALRDGRNYLVPRDIRGAAEDTLCLTLILSPQAEAQEVDMSELVCAILDMIEVP